MAEQASVSSSPSSMDSTAAISSHTTPLLHPVSPPPSIVLPPRVPAESIFSGGFEASPGPMTLVSNFFAENDTDSDFRSFSQLLAGAMASPAAMQMVSSEKKVSCEGEQFWPSVFTIPPGISPASLLDSPSFLCGIQSPFRISHKQALAQVTAQAAQSHYMQQMQNGYTSSTSAPFSMPPISSMPHFTSVVGPPAIENHSYSSRPVVDVKETTEIVVYSDQRSNTHASISVDKPTDDGYNWRKYGQKLVKGSEYPRSYYKCTHPNCPVKKKVERSLDGQITEIIYKGHHTHTPPQNNKRSKDSRSSSMNSKNLPHMEMGFQDSHSDSSVLKDDIIVCSAPKGDRDSSLPLPEPVSGSSDEFTNSAVVEERVEDEPDSKRRVIEAGLPDASVPHKTITEPRIIVQTTSEVDLLDDGYRWRKYGQKVVKGNPYPRSYYKCTTLGCMVRKHVERAASDPKAVITTYDGKHDHDVPVGRHCSANTYTAPTKQTLPPLEGGRGCLRPLALPLPIKEENEETTQVDGVVGV